MFLFNTLEEWHKFASQPVIVERDERYWVVHHRDGSEVQVKPENWKQVMAVVNCLNRAPIPASFAFVIKQLMDPRMELDCWNPWPTLAKLKSIGLRMTCSDSSWIVLQYKEVTVRTEVDHNAGAIVAKWDRLGFEHDDLLLFAAALDSRCVDKIDPWNGLMQWKHVHGVKLVDDGVYGLKLLSKDLISHCGAFFPDGFKIKELVQLFNDGDVPPGCVTAWEPFYSAAEALPLLEKAYDTPEFEKLIARFKNGKLRRSP